MQSLDPHIYSFENFRLDPSKRLLFSESSEPVPLMPKAFEILLYLVQNSGRLIEKDEMMAAVWPDTIVEENNLTQNISALRRVLGEKHRENRFIVTVPGRGYKFVAEVRQASDLPVEGSDPEIPQSNTASLIDDKVVEQSAPLREPVTRGRMWLVAVGALTLIGLVSMGFLMWGESAVDNSALPLRSLAVLPFKPLVAGQGDESLELGMADTLIMKLSGNGTMTVRPLTAVRRFSALDQDAADAGRMLGVDAVLDGNIQNAGGRIRVIAKLVRVQDSKQLWAGQFDENSTDIFTIQDSISQRVADALRVALRDPHGGYVPNIEAYTFYMKGNFHSMKLVRPEVEKGIAYFQQAMSADPNYPLPYVGLANAYRALVLTSDVRPEEVMPKGEQAAKRAVELDPSSAGAWAALANSEFWYGYDWKAAEKHYRKAIELDANDPQPHFFYGHLLSNIGQHDKALAEIRRARELDPINPLTSALEGQMLFFAGQDDAALSMLQAAADMEPRLWLVPLFTSRIYLRRQMFSEALAAAEKAKELSGGNAEAEAVVGYALAKSGRRAEASAALSALEKRAETAYVPSYDLALVHLALGERDKALDLLEKSYNQHEALMTFLNIDPKWDELRSDSRFVTLMKRMGFDQG